MVYGIPYGHAGSKLRGRKGTANRANDRRYRFPRCRVLRSESWTKASEIDGNHSLLLLAAGTGILSAAEQLREVEAG